MYSLDFAGIPYKTYENAVLFIRSLLHCVSQVDARSPILHPDRITQA